MFLTTELARLMYLALPDSLKSAKLTTEVETKLSEVEKGTLDPNVIKLRKHEKRVHFYFVLSFFNSLNAKTKSLSS